MSQVVLQESAPSAQAVSKNFEATWKRFQSVLSPHVPAVVLDAEGTIQHLTAAARRMLEYRHDQSINTCFFSHVHSRNQYQVMRDIADMVCYGKAQATWLVRLKTGQGRWQWVKANVKNRLNGPEAAITITLRDLHET